MLGNMISDVDIDPLGRTVLSTLRSASVTSKARTVGTGPLRPASFWRCLFVWTPRLEKWDCLETTDIFGDGVKLAWD